MSKIGADGTARHSATVIVIAMTDGIPTPNPIIPLPVSAGRGMTHQLRARICRTRVEGTCNHPDGGIFGAPAFRVLGRGAASEWFDWIM
jgi:hypothetical protein